LVERLVRVEEVAGSNPAGPTMLKTAGLRIFASPAATIPETPSSCGSFQANYFLRSIPQNFRWGWLVGVTHSQAHATPGYPRSETVSQKNGCNPVCDHRTAKFSECWGSNHLQTCIPLTRTDRRRRTPLHRLAPNSNPAGLIIGKGVRHCYTQDCLILTLRTHKRDPAPERGGKGTADADIASFEPAEREW
jgi:hypothetical protein